MIPWWTLILALMVGAVLGVILLAVLSAGRDK